MTFDFEADKRELLDHYVQMASVPGAKAQAWHQVNVMAREYPNFYGDMPMLLSNAMAQKKDACV